MDINPAAAANPALGVMLHAIGGLAAASFYIPYKRVKGWSWETYWLAGGFFSWVIAPLALLLIIAPEGREALSQASGKDLFWTYFFGVLWGIGGLTFGLTMRYLGIALGYAVALGLCALFGTIMPPIFNGQISGVVSSTGGQIVLLGLLVCLIGIAASGMAGLSKERELPEEKKKESISEFSLVKGLLVAIFAGIMSASMSYGFAAGKPIAKLAIDHGTPDLWQNLPVLVVILAGGFTTNFLWCVGLNARNRSSGQYLGRSTGNEPVPLLSNYVLCALAGVTWYLQFFFYGMGTTKMGAYDFSSWTLHMASIIAFSTLWGIALKEWKGTSVRTKSFIGVGLALLALSMVVVGIGNTRMAEDAKKTADSAMNGERQ
jgi:L-rhamnose-H+ transport protein